MSKFSQTYGSFIRTGNYPLEADYIFNSEQELIEFYQGDVQQTLLHQGLLKVVGEGDHQALYWIIKEDGQLRFKKLIENADRNIIYNDLTDLYAKLQQEIADREAADVEIWGDKDSIIESLNSIKKISDALDIEIKKLDKLHNEFNAAIGVEDRDIIEYLKTLPYTSLTEIAVALNHFLTEVDSADTEINTFKELQLFLEGITNSDKLLSLLENLKNSLLGSPLPSDNLNTLRKIEDAIITLSQVSKNRTDNIQTELDSTQSSVGLNQDGSYSPDTSTNYLQTATSVMHALRILDSLMHTALSDIALEKEDTNTVALTITKTDNGNSIKGNVKLSNLAGNQLLAKEDGIYNFVELDYQSGILQLKVNGNIINSYVLGFSSLVEDAYYDPDTESIIITFKLLDDTTQIVRIPVGTLIREWEPNNLYPDKVVEITREEVINGADKLSADVRVSTQPDNVLQKDGNTLYVSRTTIEEPILGQLQDDLNTLETTLETQITSVRDALATESNRAIAEETALRNQIASFITQIEDLSVELNDLKDRIAILETKTSW